MKRFCGFVILSRRQCTATDLQCGSCGPSLELISATDLIDVEPMVKPRHRRPLRYRGLSVAGACRRVGRIGAGVALAIQLLLPFIAMSQASSMPAVSSTTPLAQAAALWGSDAICTLGAVTKQDSKQNPLTGQCPICWAVQQTASLLPPSGGIALAPPTLTRIEAPSAATEKCAEPAYSPAQPRGPPLV